MEEKKKTTREDELDAFWDLSSLLPRKPSRTPPPRRNTDAVEVLLSPPTAESASKGERIPAREEAPIRRYIPPHTAAEEQPQQPMEEYEPQDSLLHKVRLYPWKSSYHYYDEFVRDAERLLLLRGSEVPRVPFFSYVPQYSQLSRAQLAWYLWWRDCFRHGEAIPTDYSYLLLFAYELINLSGKTDARQTQEYLLRLWRDYRATYTQLDAYLAEWICDYSLIHRLPPPDVTDGETLSAILSHCTLREFYIRGEGERGYAAALLAFCCNHNYKKSKFYTETTKALFDRVIPGVLAEVLRRTSDEDRLFSAVGMQDSRLLRDAYTGALCSYRFKRKIEVEYASFSRSHELRFLVTDVVKYTENALRAHLGVRSRLTVQALPPQVRECVDEILLSLLPARQTPSRKVEERPAYERLYDLESNELSLTEALEIEKASWETTERLVGAFAEEEEPAPPSEPEPLALPPDEPPLEEDWMEGLAPYRTFLSACLTGDPAAAATAANAQGMLVDLVADRINELAADGFGDVLLEEEMGGYAVIEDYRPLVSEWLQTGEGSLCGEEM